jgi:catechol 1,2-dioxygenase
MFASDPGARLTEKAVKAYAGIEDSRLRELLARLIRHLHGCVKEVRPTEQEWEFAWTFMKRMAEFTGDERNEFLLLADVIGISQLVELIGHDRSVSAVGFALVGPFYRANAPFRLRGESVVSADTAGDRVRISGKVYDLDSGSPVVDAVLDVWQAATNGLYENQDENQPDYNLRGRFRTDEAGTFELVALLPTAYPVPTDGPVGELLRVAERSVLRPAHIHFIVSAPGYETLITQVFVDGDKMIDSDVVFTASDNMTGKFQREGDHFRLQYDFQLKTGASVMPKAPIPS